MDVSSIKLIFRSLFGQRWLQYAAALSCTISMFISGMEFVWPSPSLPKLLSSPTNRITPDEGSWLATFSPFGDFFGAPVATIITDRFGRKPALLLAVLPYFLSKLVVFSSQTLPWLLLARFLVGISDGMNFTLIPMYISETADKKIRGRLGNLITAMADIGSLFTYCIGPYLSISAMAAIGATFPIIMITTFIFMPESPYFHCMKGNIPRARATLRDLRGKYNVERELSEINEGVVEDMTMSAKWTDLLRKRHKRSMIIALGLKTVQQFSGISAFLVYSEIIFREAKGTVSAELSAMVFGFVQLLSSVFSVLVVDTLGRKPLLLSSCLGCVLPLLAQGTYFYLMSVGVDLDAWGWVPIVAMVLFIVTYCYGLGAIVFMIPGELFSSEIRAKALCVCDIYFAVTAGIVIKMYHFLSQTFGNHVPFFIFAVCCILGAIFIQLCVPETKDRSLEEIQSLLKGHKINGDLRNRTYTTLLYISRSNSISSSRDI